MFVILFQIYYILFLVPSYFQFLPWMQKSAPSHPVVSNLIYKCKKTKQITLFRRLLTFKPLMTNVTITLECGNLSQGLVQRDQCSLCNVGWRNNRLWQWGGGDGELSLPQFKNTAHTLKLNQGWVKHVTGKGTLFFIHQWYFFMFHDIILSKHDSCNRDEHHGMPFVQMKIIEFRIL